MRKRTYHNTGPYGADYSQLNIWRSLDAPGSLCVELVSRYKRVDDTIILSPDQVRDLAAEIVAIVGPNTVPSPVATGASFVK